MAAHRAALRDTLEAFQTGLREVRRAAGERPEGG